MLMADILICTFCFHKFYQAWVGFFKRDKPNVIAAYNFFKAANLIFCYI